MTDETADLPPSPLVRFMAFWPVIVLLVGGAAVVGEARYRLSHLEGEVHQNEQQQEVRYEAMAKELQSMNNELRNGLGRVQLSMARICIKLDVECD